MTTKIGRPFSQDRKNARKTCEACGKTFGLEGKRYLSLKKFQARRFCSASCSNAALSGGASAKNYIQSRVEISPSGCWEWTRKRHAKGYGLGHIHGKHVRAHRVAYEAFKGAIPHGLMVLHSCDNPPCCNPDHLRVGTAKDNRADAISRGRVKESSVPDEALTGTLISAAKRTGLHPNTIWKRRNLLGLTRTNNQTTDAGRGQ